jgi:hypothetical protein
MRAFLLAALCMIVVLALIGLGVGLALAGFHPGIAVGVPFFIAIWAWLTAMFQVSR